MRSERESARWWIGHDVLDDGGRKIGSIDEIYLDETSRQPEWIAIKTGMFGHKLSFAPLSGSTVSESGNELIVPYSKDHVKGAPRIDPDGGLDAAEEDELFDYYGQRSHGAEPTAGTTSPAGEGMTRSEEELNVRQHSRETGRARLRKYVVTEDVTMTVPVRREEVRLEREPITDATAEAGAAEIGAEEQEVVLHTEETEVQKRVVPKERVRLDKDVVTEERQVSEEVRKEEIDVEQDDELDVDRDFDRDRGHHPTP